MVNAYILIQTEVGKAGQVTEQIRVIEGVVAVDPDESNERILREQFGY